MRGLEYRKVKDDENENETLMRAWMVHVSAHSHIMGGRWADYRQTKLNFN